MYNDEDVVDQKVVDIIEKVLQDLLSDIEDVKGTEFEDLTEMYQEDHDYGRQCLDEYLEHRNGDLLCEALRNQDTAPRGLYWEVFEMIEE